MREDELITEIREAAQLPTDFADYSDAVIRRTATNILQNDMAPALAAARVGIMLQRRDLSTVAGRAVVQLPPRSMAAGFECLDLTDGTSYWPLTEVLPNQAWQYEQSTRDRPRFYCVQSAGVKLFPTPDRVYSLRTQFYVRPSIIVEKQETDLVGLIDSVNYDTRQIAIASFVSAILNRLNGDAAISSQHPIDIISADDGAFGDYATIGTTYDYSLCHAEWSSSGGFSQTITLAAGPDIGMVKVGDMVRAFNQSEWPLMPHEHHILLVHATAAKICGDRGMANAAQEQSAKYLAGMSALKDGVQPRVKASAQALVPAAHMLRGRRGWTL